KARTSIDFLFSSRGRHTRFSRDRSSDVCSSDLSPGCCGCPRIKYFRPGGFFPPPRQSGNSGGEEGKNRKIPRLFRPGNSAGRPRSEERRVGKECRSGGAAQRERNNAHG